MLSVARRTIEVVLSQHVEDAALQRNVRSVLVRAPHRRLNRLQRLDERLAASLDGIAQAGDDGLRACAAALDTPGTGQFFTATVRAIEGRSAPMLDRAGVVGDAHYVPWLVRQMAEPALARVAGEAFSLITGLDLAEAEVAAWWQAQGSRFTPGTRHFLGQPLSVVHCLAALKTGSQRQRAAAAEHLCLLKPGTPLFNTAAPAWRQKRLLEEWTA